jgi:hypothetical protein
LKRLVDFVSDRYPDFDPRSIYTSKNFDNDHNRSLWQKVHPNKSVKNANLDGVSWKIGLSDDERCLIFKCLDSGNKSAAIFWRCNSEGADRTIIFEDHFQDFTEWDIDDSGYVIACRPFQSWAWNGAFVLHHDKLNPGDHVHIVTKSFHPTTVKYPVKEVISHDS